MLVFAFLESLSLPCFVILDVLKKAELVQTVDLEGSLTLQRCLF
jgi:hypothetical protein